MYITSYILTTLSHFGNKPLSNVRLLRPQCLFVSYVAMLIYRHITFNLLKMLILVELLIKMSYQLGNLKYFL